MLWASCFDTTGLLSGEPFCLHDFLTLGDDNLLGCLSESDVFRRLTGSLGDSLLEFEGEVVLG